MTTTVELYEALQAAGVRITVRGIRIIADAPKGVLNERMIEWIKAHRVEFASHVRLNSPCPKCGCTKHVDITIHADRTSRRDCSRCGRTKGFPVWQSSDGNTGAVGGSAGSLHKS